MLKEVWRPVLGYEDLYQVSNLGRVISQKGEIFPNRTASGAPVIWLARKGDKRSCNVRKLMWEAFHGAVGEEFYVVPIDRSKPDYLDNLKKVDSLKEVAASKSATEPKYVKYRYKIPRIKQLLDQGYHKSEIVTITGLTIHTVNKLIEEAGL